MMDMAKDQVAVQVDRSGNEGLGSEGRERQRALCSKLSQALLLEAFAERESGLDATSRIFEFVSPADLQRISSVVVREWNLQHIIPDEILEECDAPSNPSYLRLAKAHIVRIHREETDRQQEEILTRQMFPQLGTCDFTAADWENETEGRGYFTAAYAVLCQEQRNGGLPHLNHRDILAISQDAVSDLYGIARLPRDPGDEEGLFRRMNDQERENYVLSCAQAWSSNLNQSRIQDRGYRFIHVGLTYRGFPSEDERL